MKTNCKKKKEKKKKKIVSGHLDYYPVLFGLK